MEKLSLLCPLLTCLLLGLSLSEGHMEGWEQITGGLKHVTASVNYVWGVTKDGEIYMCERPCTGSNWVKVSGSLKQLDADDYEVWGVNSEDQIFKRSVDGDGVWIHVQGSLKHVSASGNGWIWGVNSSNHIFKCKKPCNGSWTLVNGRLSEVDGGSSRVYGVTSHGVYVLNVDGSGGWTRISGAMKHVTVSEDEVFGVAPNNEIYRCKKPCTGGSQWEKMVGEGAQIDATFNGLFAVDHSYNIWRHTLGF